MTEKKQITIHQAFYGEVNFSHGCLYSTNDDVELKAFLTGFTDRPSSLPAGMVLQPYYSAIKNGKYFLFTLTFPDHTARRAGMVFTHVLILNIEDIVYVNNLEILIHNFCETIPDDKSLLNELVIPISLLELNKTIISFPAYVMQVVKELSIGKLPILFCGEPVSFITLITSIWAGLPQVFRTRISYTAGFSIANIDATKTIIHFQKNLEDSLRNFEFVSDSNNDLIEVNSTVEKYILTPLGYNQFEKFIKDLNVNLNDWSILQSCAKAYESYQNYKQLNNDALKQLIRQLGKISPNKYDGRSIKDKIICEIKQRLEKTKENNLKSLRNLPLDAFYSGEDILADSVKSFIMSELGKNKNFDDRTISEVIVISQNGLNSNWWNTAIMMALKNAINNEVATTIQNIWRILIKSEDSLVATLSFFPQDRKYEQLLLKYIPQNIPKAIAENFATAIQKRKWIILHSCLITTFLTPKEAAKQQLSLEKKLSINSFEGTNLIIKNISNKELLNLALETNENLFIKEYATRCVKKPILLNDLNIQKQTWLSIWAKTLEETNRLDHGIRHLSETIEQLLNSILEGMEVPEEITAHIAKSEFADISGLKNRAALWQHLPFNVKGLFLEATANGLLKDISYKGLAGVDIEMELMNYISSDKYMAELLKRYRSDMNTILEVYEYIANLKDLFLADYIKYFPNNLNNLQSARLGDLILTKRFDLSATQVFEKAKYNDSFKIALTKCQVLIKMGFLDTFFYGYLFGKTLSNEEAYSALTEISTQLYSQGPEDRNIWQRAEGDLSKLHHHKSREENWRTAIYLLKNGGGGKNISAKSLINEMIEDYPNNSQLKEIKKYFK